MSKKSRTRRPPPAAPLRLLPRSRIARLLVAALALSLTASGVIIADWWSCMPQDAQATYVGRSTCMECHVKEFEEWEGSHHDMAMDLATPETVLGDFDNAQLTHFGITSRMYQRDGAYMIRTEGPDGAMADFAIKYVLGFYPLQQYMVEFPRPAGSREEGIGKVQVVRVSWDTVKKRWFYLSPPDVDEKLAPDDPLHWTQPAQNWNHMCADCHSTNVRKNFDVATKTYHTTFSEIDVSCEACHGPGSIHVQLARGRSLFWDRRLGYGLPRLKSEDSRVEIESCAPCHSRRHVVCAEPQHGEPYYESYVNELLHPETYYPDGQVLDEVYVYGSFIQSKMYHNDIRCTDCHNPHTVRVKQDGNKLCTSCHQHDPAKYDTPAHHRHEPNSTGALCVECHMPEWPFMEVDPRRDHSLRIPRPELSVKLQTPNACTGCHLEPEKISGDKRARLHHYADWMKAAREGDQEIRDELARLDRWSLETVRLWYGEPAPDPRQGFAEPLARAWRHDPAALPDLLEVARNRQASGMVRASVLEQLVQFSSPQTWSVAQSLVRDSDPQVRAAVIRNLENAPRRIVVEHIVPLLQDPVRTVRIEAARALASLPSEALNAVQERARQIALDEYRKGMLAQGDQAGAHLALGVLAERQGQLGAAAQAYRTAIYVQPRVTGPRSNLAAVLEQAGGHDAEVSRLRREELDLLRRDVQLAPQGSTLHYRLGLSLYLHGQMEESERELAEACRLDPYVTDYRMALALLYKKQQRWKEALASVNRLLELRPDDPTYLAIRQEILQESKQ